MGAVGRRLRGQAACFIYVQPESANGVRDVREFLEREFCHHAPQFGDFLAKSVNEKTGKPFIVKEKKRGVKKNTFAALISAAAATEEGD